MFKINIPHLDLLKTYKSGQMLRWKQIDKSKFFITHGNYAVAVAQKKDTFTFHCTDEEFYSVWYDYFDVACLYDIFLQMFSNFPKVSEQMVERIDGVRVINQNPYELLVSSFVYKFALNSKLKHIFCEFITSHGKKRSKALFNIGSLMWQEFPTPETIVKYSHELKTVCPEIVLAAELQSEKWIDLYSLDKMSTSNIFNALGEYPFLSKSLISRLCVSGYGKRDQVLYTSLLEEHVSRRYDCDLEWFNWEFLLNSNYEGLESLISQFLIACELGTKGVYFGRFD